jgi:hypothetical protein
MSLLNTAAYIGVNGDHVFLFLNSVQQYTEVQPFSPIRYSLCSDIPLACEGAMTILRTRVGDFKVLSYPFIRFR